MPAKYLIRLDDALPSMDAERWAEVEALLLRYQIKPLVAVIPNNEDVSLKFDDDDPNFWARVREWQKAGWAIGLHGYNHRYHSISRDKSIVPFHDRSEFVGLSLSDQKEKLVAGMKIFAGQGLVPDLFIAPSHSFDHETLRALLIETPIRVISDGIACGPFKKNDIWFIPQQLWAYKWRPFGVWTICLHPNTITVAELENLESKLRKYPNRFISLSDLKFEIKWYSVIIDKIFEIYFWAFRSLRSIVVPYRFRKN